MEFSEQEWVEIYYALDMKKLDLESGKYGSIKEPIIFKWIFDLKQIMEKISPEIDV